MARFKQVLCPVQGGQRATRNEVGTTRSARIDVEWEPRFKFEVKVRRAPIGERGGRD